MNKLIRITIIIAVMIGALTSCSKDKEAPLISISTPEEHSEHLWGDEVHIMAELTDDQNLKSYSVLIGDEEGMHDHDFDYMESDEIDGLSFDFHDHFVVPDSAKLMRWIHFTVTDMNDKSTSKKWMVHFKE